MNQLLQPLKYAYLLAVTLVSIISVQALAQEKTTPEPNWTYPINVSLLSDNIFRGQSQTWGKPALQFSAEADHKGGFYAGFFASNVSDNWIPGATVETDYYTGYRGKASDITIDVGAIYYVYPGSNWDKSSFVGANNSNKVDTLEAYLGLTYQWLNFKFGGTQTEYFGWNTNNSPVNGGFAGDAMAGVTGSTKGSHFYELNANYEVAPNWNLIGQAGRQVITNSIGLDINYYKIGVTKTLDAGWSTTAAYSTTNKPAAYMGFPSLRNNGLVSDIAKDTLFISVTKSF